MKQPESLSLVAEFHRTFHHPVLKTPAIPDEKRCRLRVELLTEELRELDEAIREKDLVAVADEIRFHLFQHRSPDIQEPPLFHFH
jgi:predicted HAD superfamily Cof-like phosphohydrolase